MDAFISKLEDWTWLICLFLASSREFPLGILLATGAYFRDFSIRPEQVLLDVRRGPADAGHVLDAYSVEAANITQRHHHLPQPDVTAEGRQSARRSDRRSRCDFVEVALPISWGSISSIPATFGVIFTIIFLSGTWVSPGQWGQDVAVAGWVVMLGMLVTNRARRGASA